LSSTPPELAPLPDEPPPSALVRRVSHLLETGQLVALPTETVYGLAARADRPDALARLAALKGAAESRGWTWHVGTPEALEAFGSLRPLARRLAQRYWPGPLTLVLEGVPAGLERVALDGWTGVRLPAHRGTAALLAAVDFPVVMTSANESGGTPATQAALLARSFGSALALVLDGGPSRLGESSAVLRLGRGRFELLREGLLSVPELRRTAGLSLLFVCTGNTCRSPMAESLARAELERRLAPPGGELSAFGFELASAGLFASPGAPASPLAVEVLGANGLTLSEHRSRLLDERTLAGADRVYALTHAHLEALAQRAELAPGARLELLDPHGEDIPDPMGGERSDYVAAAERITRAIAARADEWA